MAFEIRYYNANSQFEFVTEFPCLLGHPVYDLFNNGI